MEKEVLQPRGLFEPELWEQELIESDAGKRGSSTTWAVWIGIMRTRTNWVNGREKEVLQPRGLFESELWEQRTNWVNVREKEVLQPRGLFESELWEQELIESASWKRRFFNYVASLNRNYENKNWLSQWQGKRGSSTTWPGWIGIMRTSVKRRDPRKPKYCEYCS